eukprot:154633_1
MTSRFEIKEHGLLNFCSVKMNINDTMVFMDNINLVNNEYVSETQYKLVKADKWTILDEIYEHLLKANVTMDSIDKYTHFLQMEEYDSDCVEFDLSIGNILNCIQNQEVIDEIKQIFEQPRTNNKYEDKYFKYNESFIICPGSYEIYLKNEALFGE